MATPMRYLLLLISAVQFLFAIAFFLQLPFAVNLWPFEGTTPLTFIFVSSILAAAAASTFWVAASRQYAALVGIALDYLAILTPLALFSFTLTSSSGNSRLTAFGVACLLGALVGMGFLLWSMRFPLDRALPTPRPVLWSFALFVVALLIVSTRLLLKAPNVIPWTITSDLSVLIGWMFFGASIYFLYGLLRPTWANAAGQLAGFLAYDIVLIVPFLTRLPSTPPQHRTGLIIYTIVVTYSGLLAIYYLFVDRRTRVWPLERPAAAPRLRY